MSAPVLTTWATKSETRTSAVTKAVTQELRTLASTLDSAKTVRSVTISVKMCKGSIRPRAVIVLMETETTLDESSD